MADFIRVDIRELNKFLTTMDKGTRKNLAKRLRAALRIIQKAIKRDYAGVLLRRRTGRLLKSIKVSLLTAQLGRGNILGRVFSRFFVARLFEKGFVHTSGKDIHARKGFELNFERHRNKALDEIGKALTDGISQARRS